MPKIEIDKLYLASLSECLAKTFNLLGFVQEQLIAIHHDINGGGGRIAPPSLTVHQLATIVELQEHKLGHDIGHLNYMAGIGEE